MQIAKCPECLRLVTLSRRPAVRILAALTSSLLVGPHATSGEQAFAAVLGFGTGVFLDESLAHHCPECNVALEVIASLVN